MATERSYFQLRPEERDVIAQMRAMSASIAEIARCLGRSESTIRREIRRNGCLGWYCPHHAQQAAERRRCAARRASCKLHRPEVAAYVIERLERQWSGDQIAGRIRRDFPRDSRFRLSGQTIYTWLRRHDHGRRWRNCLRRSARPKRRRCGGTQRGCRLASRPDVINRRERFGDWEGDLIVGRGAAALVSLVERRSGFVELMLVPDRTSATVIDAIRRRLGRYAPELRRSLTFDNGSEFARYAALKAALGLDIYFADPRSPWQRGSNEHVNGLVRQYFPKRTPFGSVSRRRTAIVQRLLNQRPRKRLSYQTPDEILAQQRLRAVHS